MILARYLILKICIVVCFVNLGTSMEKGETSSSTQDATFEIETLCSSTQDAAFEIETLLGSDKPIGQQSWKEYIMEIYKDATGIEECKEVLHGENYTDVGAENWNYTRTEDPNLRDLRIIPTSAEATYLLYLDNKGNKRSSSQDTTFEIETLLGSDEPIGQRSWKQYIMDIFKDAAGIDECIKILHDRGHTDVGDGNWDTTRCDEPEKRDYTIIQSPAEAVYLMYLDNEANSPYLGASEFCQTYWYRVILMEKSRAVTKIIMPVLEYFVKKFGDD